jgi:hypothetical protein
MTVVGKCRYIFSLISINFEAAHKNRQKKEGLKLNPNGLCEVFLRYTIHKNFSFSGDNKYSKTHRSFDKLTDCEKDESTKKYVKNCFSSGPVHR